MNLRAWMLAALVAVPLLQACGGGGGGGGSGALRLVNATDDFASLDLYSTDTLLTSGVATDTAGAYVPLGAGTYTLNLKRNGSSTTSGTSSRSVLADTSHTLVAYSTNSALKSVFLTDNEVAPTSATAAKLRVFNGSIEAGTLDVYVTDPGASLVNSTPFVASQASERISGYGEIAAGTYRVRVTGAGVTNDLRLDLPSVTLTGGQILTLVLTSTPGGVLVHGHLINQKDTVAAERNPSARVRLVTGTSSGTVAATVNGITLSAAQSSPIIGGYTLVPATALAVTASVNGTASTLNNTTTPLPTTLVAGSDNTLLVTGTPASSVASVISDDNRPPTNATNVKLRLVHGVANLGGPATLTADSGLVANDIAVNSASSPAGIPGNASPATTLLEVTSPASVGTLYSDNKTLLAGHTYTVFILGDPGPTAGRLSRDR